MPLSHPWVIKLASHQNAESMPTLKNSDVMGQRPKNLHFNEHFDDSDFQSLLDNTLKNL